MGGGKHPLLRGALEERPSPAPRVIQKGWWIALELAFLKEKEAFGQEKA